jgi:hypothetical protein
MGTKRGLAALHSEKLTTAEEAETLVYFFSLAYEGYSNTI